MKNDKIIEITPDVKWIGMLDPDLRMFDIVMETKYGTTYNSYFINAQKKTLVETCKAKFFDEYLTKIKTLCDSAEIEYIILNHTEPDHSGSVEHLLKIAPKATVVGSGNAIAFMKEFIGHDFPNLIVKDGQTLDLGNKTLRFIGAPNLHWPDSIYTYLEEDKLLFTCDSFGAHFCHEAMFDGEVGNYDDAFKYYYDVILKPYSKFMLKAIEKIRPLEIAAICPGHGPILRDHWKKHVTLSEEYAKETVQLPTKHHVLIMYVSAYGNTATIAQHIAEGITLNKEIEVEICDIEKIDLGDIGEKISKSTGIIMGSPTINQNTLLQIYQVFAVINPIRDRGKVAGSFGSYGWSGEACKIIEANFTNLKLNFVGSVPVKFTPHEDEKAIAVEFGKKFAAELLTCKLA
jgi:NADH oxidase (H2O-forming)